MAAPKPIALTEKMIAALAPEPGKKDRIISDAAGNNLKLWIGASGTKVWRYVYRFAGSNGQSITIGAWPHWTLAKARAEAQRLEGLRQQKRDPKLAVYNPTTAVTLGDVIDWYHDKHLTNPSTQANFTHLTKRLKADLGATPLRDFTRHVLKGWIEGRLTANNAGGLETLLRWLSSAFNQASDSLSGLDIPAGYENPAKGLGSKIPAIANRPRGSYAVSWEDDEWSHIMVAIETAYTNSPLSPLGVMVVEMIMVTGARPSEIATLRWDEIEDHKVKTGAVTLRMKKIIKDRHKTWKNTRRPRQILLGKRGIDILTRAKKYADDTGYTLPSISFPDLP
jgi:integrase